MNEVNLIEWAENNGVSPSEFDGMLTKTMFLMAAVCMDENETDEFTRSIGTADGVKYTMTITRTGGDL